MSFDILKQAAYQESIYLNGLITVANAAAILAPAQTIADTTITPNTAHCTELWSEIPTLARVSGTLCVWDNAGTYTSGASCVWTVPAGACIARFQIWGPGAASYPGNCCATSPFGSLGAYASVVMAVTPGDSYTLCAGPACTCVPYCCGSGSPSIHSGPPSFVTGNGLCNFCATGGEYSLWESMKARACSLNCTTYISNACCKFTDLIVAGVTFGLCICNNGTSMCHGNSCSTCGWVSHQGSWNCLAYGTSCRGVVWKIPSIHQGLYTSSDNYRGGVPYIRPYGFNCSACGWRNFDSGTCCGNQMGHCAGTFSDMPGMGGVASHVMGGSTTYGDLGRRGGVKVEWLCI